MAEIRILLKAAVRGSRCWQKMQRGTERGALPARSGLLMFLDVFLFEAEFFGRVEDEHFHADIRRHFAGG